MSNHQQPTMKLLITGINGFVARHFLHYINSLDESFEILGIGRTLGLAHDISYDKLNIQYCDLDLLEKKKVSVLIADFKPDYILHLASVSSVGLSWQYPHESFVNNTNIFLNLIEELRNEKSTCRVLSIGSSEEYGIVAANQLPLSETAELQPVSPYAVARVSQEMISKLYAKGYGLDIIMTRSFNHIGPGQSEQFVISSFAKQLTRISRQGLHQATIKTGDLSIIRDFVDVRDVVKAYYLLLKNGMSGSIYNICSGQGNSLQHILNEMSEILGLTVHYETDPALIRPVDNPVIIGSHEKIKNELGWSPEIPLKQSLKDMINWWMLQS